jgi:prophage tail gpP-like protein
MDVKLLVNGENFTGWKSIEIQRGLTQLAGQFEFVSSNKHPREPFNWRIRLGDECVIKVDNQTVVTGYIENIPESYDASSYELAFSGRDKTGDLVDCSHDFSFGSGNANEVLNLNLRQIIDFLIQPFGINLIFDLSTIEELITTTVSEFATNPGEPVIDAINRICKSIGALPISLGDGNLTIVRAGTTPTTDGINSEINVLSANRNQSTDNRFSKYTVLGTTKTAAFGGSESEALTGVSLDTSVKRHRPTIIVSEQTKTIKQCRDQAEWENRIRAGMAKAINYTVQGWQQSDGKLWPLNGLVFFDDLNFNLGGERLISNIVYSISESEGSKTTMTLVYPATFKGPAVPLTNDETNNLFGF